MALLSDASFRAHVERYANDQIAFFDDFSAAFAKLSELGWADLTPAPYSIPEATMAEGNEGEVLVKPGMALKWIAEPNGDVTVTLLLNELVGWLAFGVSHSGQMVSPAPSHAVVGTNGGVRTHTLALQNIRDVGESAPIDDAQHLEGTSFTHDDGQTKLQFRAPLTWLTQYANAVGEPVWFIYAHGSTSTSSFGYHELHRGNVQILGFGMALSPQTTPNAPPPSILVAPPIVSSPTGSHRASADVELTWGHNADGTTT